MKNALDAMNALLKARQGMQFASHPTSATIYPVDWRGSGPGVPLGRTEFFSTLGDVASVDR